MTRSVDEEDVFTFVTDKQDCNHEVEVLKKKNIIAYTLCQAKKKKQNSHRGSALC